MNEENRKKFEKLARPLIQFLNEHGHPHMHAMITTDSAEVSEGICAFSTDDYIELTSSPDCPGWPAAELPPHVRELPQVGLPHSSVHDQESEN